MFSLLSSEILGMDFSLICPPAVGDKDLFKHHWDAFWFIQPVIFFT